MPIDFDQITKWNDELNPNEGSAIKDNLAKIVSGDIDTGVGEVHDERLKSVMETIPASLVNRVVGDFTNAISDDYCDHKCQMQKQQAKLIQQQQAIDSVKEFIPEYENEIQKQYYSITSENDPYRKWKKDRVTGESEENSEKLLEFHKKSFNNLVIDLNNYNSHFTYLNNMETMKDTYTELNKGLKNKAEDLENVKNTSFRKANYEQGYSENYVRSNNFLYAFYWGLILFFILYFIVLRKKITDFRLWSITLLLICFPFLVNYVHYGLKVLIQFILPFIGM